MATSTSPYIKSWEESKSEAVMFLVSQGWEITEAIDFPPETVGGAFMAVQARRGGYSRTFHIHPNFLVEQADS